MQILLLSHLKHPIFRGAFEQHVGVFWLRKKEQRMECFSHNIKAILDVVLLIFHAQETCKSTTHNPGLHPTSLTMASVTSHDGQIFITTAILQQAKMKGSVANDLIRRDHCSQHAAD
jgi:hypothetical protein